MISTHILDTSIGSPAKGVKVTLEKLDGDNWKQVAQGETNNDGRYAFGADENPGRYRIIFFTEDYFKSSNTESFFLATPVAFHITNTDRSYHVPLLVNPYGYSTYRGS
jgi:5-hydroxyisourate hydrolase